MGLLATSVWVAKVLFCPKELKRGTASLWYSNTQTKFRIFSGSCCWCLFGSGDGWNWANFRPKPLRPHLWGKPGFGKGGPWKFLIWTSSGASLWNPWRLDTNLLFWGGGGCPVEIFGPDWFCWEGKTLLETAEVRFFDSCKFLGLIRSDREWGSPRGREALRPEVGFLLFVALQACLTKPLPPPKKSKPTPWPQFVDPSKVPTLSCWQNTQEQCVSCGDNFGILGMTPDSLQKPLESMETCQRP